MIGEVVPEDLTIWRDAVGMDAGVYTGVYFTRLKEIELKWEYGEYNNFFTGEHLTLKQIQEQCKDEPIIWVITMSALHGYIYEYGNYNDGKWRLFGEHMGYA